MTRADGALGTASAVTVHMEHLDIMRSPWRKGDVSDGGAYGTADGHAAGKSAEDFPEASGLPQVPALLDGAKICQKFGRSAIDDAFADPGADSGLRVSAGHRENLSGPFALAGVQPAVPYLLGETARPP